MIRITILMCSTLLTGCAAQWPGLKSGRPVDTAAPAAEIVSFGRLLEREPDNTLITLSDSPWGSNVRVLLHETYAAASGRNCRRLTVEPETQSYPALMCRHPNKDRGWLPVRLLQIGGRPVLSHTTTIPAWNGGQ